MRTILRLFAFALIVAVVGALWVSQQLNQPYQGFSDPVFVEFAKGTSTRQMADELTEKGVLAKPWQFLLLRALEREKTLQAGEYQFTKAASPRDVFRKIARGDIFYLELLVPEGFNMYEIAEAAGKLGIMKPAEFLAQAANPALIHDLDPAAPSLEGFLFPNKYRVRRHTSAQQLCRMMTAEFRQRWLSLHATADLHATLTLASLVEREARRPDERPLVASVFSNRLRIGMKLDCDPTTVYAALLQNRYRGTIYKSDLANDSPWNTYRHAGLPPGPIANPGLSSIQAALAPADSAFLYFVAKADGSGGHTFSESLMKHEAAVAQYQRATHH